uniref:Poly [ADP-ribose] polymerase n=1 Tax=Neogobius melanostomus TaxID=47308 RepID=A0A8C6T9F0_9GOBI
MDECGVVVEGDWAPEQNRTVKNKLLKYFLSEKKSGGGECQVEPVEGVARANVVFTSRGVRDRVLAKPSHEITLEQRTVRLRVSSADSPIQTSTSSDPDPQETEVKRQRHEAPPTQPEKGSGVGSDTRFSPGRNPAPEDERGCSVTLGPVSEDLSRDLLGVLVENLSGVEEGEYELELIWESKVAVVTFRSHTDAEKFVSVSQSSSKLSKYGLASTLLKPATSVRVESLPPHVAKDMLDLYFEKNWTAPDNVVMIPEEKAAVLSFTDPKVVKDICSRTDLTLKSTRVKVYPFYESLDAALMGPDRPEFKMPEAFTEPLLVPVWKFLHSKDLSDSINQNMGAHFCHVNLDKPQVKLSPSASFLRQKDLTKERVEGWQSAALKAFREQVNEYAAFDCPVNDAAWRQAEREVRTIVKDDVELSLDQAKKVLTVAGRIKDIKRLRVEVEDTVHKAVKQIDREMNGVEEKMPLAPAMFHILNHSGLQKEVRDISPDMHVDFDQGVLAISGLQGEVFKLKNWILEKTFALEREKRRLDLANPLQDFLRNVDVKQLSEDLFTSQGICAFISVETKGLFLVGSSERFMGDAEKKLESTLIVKMLNYQDAEVVKLKKWSELVNNLLESYNTSRMQVVQVQVQPQKITIAGFANPVNEAGQNLGKFINDFSRVQERVKVESCAVIQFIEKKKMEEWSSIARDNQVNAEFDPERPKFTISGPRLHAHNAKALFLKLTQSLVTDTFQVQKPGARKFFMTQGALFLSTILNEFGCAVILRPDLPDDEEDYEEIPDIREGECGVTVRTVSGIAVLVKKADMCKLKVDAVVNAANEDLRHIGGLALALLNAAGPELQRDCDGFIKQNGKLSPGQTFVTKSYRLPCKHVIHAVGPRYTENEAKLANFLLKLAVKDSLTQAEKLRCSNVALPAISSGIFGFPVELCVETIAQAVREFCDDPVNQQPALQEVLLVDNNDKTVKALTKAVKTEFSDLRPTVDSGEKRVQTQGAVGGGKDGWDMVVYEELNQQPERPRPKFTPVARLKPGPKGQKLEQTTPEGFSISLVKGNIQDQTTDVIVNTIGENMNLQQGAVSKALLGAAGSGLQAAVVSAASEDTLPFGEVVITNGFNLRCQKVFHTVCPPWDNGGRQAQTLLEGIICSCLEEAERLQMSSLSLPALGTGNLNFPRDVVSALLLREVHAFSRDRRPRHLRAVSVVVHPTDERTVECFTKEFKGLNPQRSVQSEAEFEQSPRVSSQSQQPSASSFGQVKTLSLGVHQMQMGHVTLEVSSGDITKETCDVIINSSNQDFTLKSGVSKAIVDAAGRGVELECANIVNSPGYQPKAMITTSAGQLPSKNIIHVTGSKDPASIKNLVYGVLKVCEENKLQSVAFPALGTGAAQADPSLVADAMVGAVEDFVRKKSPKSVRSVKILIFQTAMISEFHKSMKSREGQPLVKGFMHKVKDFISPLTSLLGLSSETPHKDAPVLESQEFEPTVFQLCAETQRAVVQAKKRIEELIISEQAQRTISDPVLVNLTQSDVDRLRELQRNLTVHIRLERRSEEEMCVHLEGLTRDVSTAESAVRDMIRKVERSESRKKDAFYLSGLVEWHLVLDNGHKQAFDMMTNLALEEAFAKKKTTKITINKQMFTADPERMRADCDSRHKTVEIYRREVKAVDASVPSEWSDMKSDELLKLVTLQQGSKEFQKVETEVSQTGLQLNILSIERVQNVSLWKNYQIKKKEMDTKNKHQNNEKVLYHGTGPNSIDLINKQGFNRSYAGAHAAMYGNGTYFAVDPAYSVNRGYSQPDANGHKRLYVALVLVGEFTTGRQKMLTPPAKGNPSELYDSVTDQMQNPSMFIIFNDVQAYPQYLITFT